MSGSCGRNGFEHQMFFFSFFIAVSIVLLKKKAAKRKFRPIEYLLGLCPRMESRNTMHKYNLGHDCYKVPLICFPCLNIIGRQEIKHI